MYDCLRSTFDCFKSLTDDVLSGLCQYLDRYIVRNQVLLDQCTDKGVFCFRCCREPNFNLLKTDLNKQFEKFYFLLKTHRDYQCLVSVTQVYAAPDWGFVYVFFFCPFHTFYRWHKILSFVFCYVFHDHSSIFAECFAVQSKKKSLISTDYCKRRKTTVFAVPLLFMNGSYTHGIRN